MRTEQHNLHGTGWRDHEVYDLPRSPDGLYWAAVTDVPCPVEGCSQTVLWYEAGYVPGYRVCMAPAAEPGRYDMGSIKHKFLAKGNAAQPTLVRDDCCE